MEAESRRHTSLQRKSLWFLQLAQVWSALSEVSSATAKLTEKQEKKKRERKCECLLVLFFLSWLECPKFSKTTQLWRKSPQFQWKLNTSPHAW